MKKNFLFLLATTLMLTSLTGCNSDDNKVINDGKTINIKVYEGGYKTTWIYQLKEKFETLYKSEGYKVNILPPSGGYEGASVLSEMRISDNGVDMYFVQNVKIDDVVSIDYGTCVENLDDVYNSYPIQYDGHEEETKIKDKLGENYQSIVSDGTNYYGFLWANSPCGLIVNSKVLDNYDLDIPLTTNQLFACYDVIKESGNIKPFAWGGDDAYGYALYALYPYLGQLLGQEKMAQFMRMQSGDNIIESDYLSGYEIYDDDKLYQALVLVQKMYATSSSVNGSLTGTNLSAHHALLTGKAAFTVDGDFFYNEVKNDYSSKLGDIKFVNIPVASDLGVNLKLDGSGENATLCDTILSEVIKLVDQNKTVNEIKDALSTYSLNEEQIMAVKEARSVYYEKDCSLAYISKGSKVSDICKLLLRVAASDDFGHTFNSVASTTFPYCSSNNLSANEFSKGVNAVISQNEAWTVCNLKTSGLRKSAGIPIFPTYSSDIILTLVTENKSSDEIKTKIKNNVSQNWSKWMKNAGYSV